MLMSRSKKNVAKRKISSKIWKFTFLCRNLAMEFMCRIVIKKEKKRERKREGRESFADTELLKLATEETVPSAPCFINASSESASLWSLPRAYPTLSTSLLAV